jgi:Peptidase C1-like family
MCIHVGMRIKLLSALALAGASLAAFACSTTHGNSSTSDQGVTSIPQTPVTDQGDTGSCWLYATANWAESLHTQANGNSIHFSPAYWLYWEFYDQLVSGQPAVHFGGYWGRAAEIIQSYGLMPLGAFEIDDAAAQLAALDALNAKAAAGVFGPAGTPRNPALVRAALDDAFQLGNDARALLTNVFGDDGLRTFRAGASASGAILRAADVSVKTPSGPGQPLVTSTLDVLLGAGQPNAGSADDRAGAGAWTAAYPPATQGLSSMMKLGEFPGGRPLFRPAPSVNRLPGDEAGAPVDDGGGPVVDDGGSPLVVDAAGAPANANPIAGLPPLTPPDPVAWRAFFKRIQRALNDGVPVPMAWMVIDADIDRNGRFRAGSPIVGMSLSGGHETILSDYEITNVPGYGTLGAGAPASAAQKAAALDDSASITFFRVKNSWGTNVNVTGFQNLAGYNDLDVGYLQQPIDWCDDSQPAGPPGSAPTCYAVAPQVWDVILPPGY